jgi:hypothetical protein
MNFVILQFSPSFCYIILLMSKYFPFFHAENIIVCKGNYQWGTVLNPNFNILGVCEIRLPVT